MLDFKKYLATNGCIVLKQFKNTEDRYICLVRRPDGSRAVWRLYNRPVLAYKSLTFVKCTELPEVYHYTDIDHGGCLVEEEYIDGLSLAELIETHSLDEYQTAAIAHRVCKALTILHHKNMVHRDIKPENILITSNGRVVLIDLDAVSPRTSAKNRDTQLLGTVGYAAPEQYGFGHSDGRTDIFGVGVLMNVLLTGKHPVQELTGGTLRPIVEKCIAVNADQRYATVEELMSQLPDHTAQRCSLCGFTSPGGGCIFCGIHTKKALTKRPRNSRLIVAAVLLGILVGSIGLIWAGEHTENDVQTGQPPSTAQSELPTDNTPSPSPTPSSKTDDKDPQPEVSPAAPSVSPDISAAPSVSPDTSAAPSVSPDASAEPTVEPPDNPPNPTAEPENVSPSASVPPKENSPAPDPSLPDFSGEPTYRITSFLYDLDGDGTEEEYYFGLMTETGDKQIYSSKLVITSPETPDEVSARKIAPAVWTMDQNNILIPVPQFASLLQEVGITFYQYKGNDTLPATLETDPLNGLWGSALEISCGYEDTGNWVAVSRAVLNETELTSDCHVLIRPSSTVVSTPVQPILLTEGPPAGEPFAITFNSKDELLVGKYEIFNCTAQYLDNGHIRFSVDFVGPNVQRITVFDPPDGALFKYTKSGVSSGERELLIFDLPEDQVRAAKKISLSFNCGNGSRFLVFFNDVSGL